MAKKPRFRRKPTGKRRFQYVPKSPTAIFSRVFLKALTILFLVAGVYLAGKLVAYYTDYQTSRKQSEVTSAIYYGAQPTDQEQQVPMIQSVVDQDTTEYAAPTRSTQPAEDSHLDADLGLSLDIQAEMSPTLEPMSYPNNPMRQIQPKFTTLQRRNKDIIGWLKIEDLVDEAVVQRDNKYYLKRDHLGYRNVNGALFLDGQSDLSTRPHALYIYGHNMRSGAMFGNLRYYSRIPYYKSNPFLIFDTLYEDGEYVVFAAAEVALDVNSARFTGIFQLHNGDIQQRRRALERLRKLSAFANKIDVQPHDQLLFLVTCTDNDKTRSVVAARRLRTEENRTELNRLIAATYLQ